MNQAEHKQDIRESLSAGMDGELPDEQLRFLLRRLDHDVSLQQSWARYHLVGDGLRREMPPLASAGFARRVMLAIEQESGAAAVVNGGRHRWLRWSGGGLIAASVAVAALMISQPSGDGGHFGPPAHSPGNSMAVAAPATHSMAPVSVPPWLSGNSAGLLSQQASATLGAPFGGDQAGQTRRLSPYSSVPRYRTLDNNDGSYLLLLDPAQPGVPATARPATAVAQ